MRELTPLQYSALQLIMERDMGNPITGKDIASRIGLKPQKRGEEQRDMRSIIHALRVKGFPVCATGGGYWWPVSDRELREFIDRFDKRVQAQVEAVNGLKNGFNKVGKPTEKVAQKEPEILYYRHEGQAVQVLSNKIEEFLSKYPNAEKI